MDHEADPLLWSRDLLPLVEAAGSGWQAEEVRRRAALLGVSFVERGEDWLVDRTEALDARFPKGRPRG